jgi:hypothetical protein
MRVTRGIMLSLVVLSPVRGTAQVRVEVGPILGYYRPYGSFDSASVYSTALPNTPQNLKGGAWGGDARVWFGKRLGTELKALVAHSTIPEVFTPAGPRGPTPATITTASAQGLLTVLGTPARHQVWVSAGVGAIRHGGDSYASYGSPWDFGLAVGAGARIRLTPHVHATFGLTTLVYTFDLPMPPALRLNPGSLEHGRQVDVLTHVGLSWMVGAR